MSSNVEKETASTPPLSGVRVVAWEHAVAGPLASRHLLDLGAEVIKVERSGDGDMAREYDGTVNGLSSHFIWLNRGKRSIALDLKTDAGMTALHRLIETSDVFLQNQGPGAADRLGLGNRLLCERYPRLVACAISGFGDGPYRNRKAYDLIVQGETGIMGLTGSPEMPMRVGIPVADLAAGMYAFSTILAALYRRLATGEGSSIEISMFDALLEWASAALYVAKYSGRGPERSGQRHGTIVPYGAYRVLDGQINLAVQTDAQWRRLCTQVLDLPALADDERFRNNELRWRNRATLEGTIETKWASLTRSEVEQRLTDADIPFGDIREIRDVLDHPQLAGSKRWISVSTRNGPIEMLRHPMAISGMPDLPNERLAIPDVGEHTREILDELGLRGTEDTGISASAAHRSEPALDTES